MSMLRRDALGLPSFWPALAVGWDYFYLLLLAEARLASPTGNSLWIRNGLQSTHCACEDTAWWTCNGTELFNRDCETMSAMSADSVRGQLHSLRNLDSEQSK
jgi:hypothetical protein